MTKSEQHELFEQLSALAIGKRSYFGRPILRLSKESFEPFKQTSFHQSINILNKWHNYRTDVSIKHLHAIEQDQYVEIHYDYGNVDKTVLFGIPHFFADVIPYFLYHLLTWKHPYKGDV